MFRSSVCVVGATRGVLTQLESWPASAEFAQCPKSITWTFHPARRTPVADGTWTLHISGGETQTANVLGGGRVLNSVALPNVGECNGPQGSVDLFIAANGVASFGQPGTATSLRVSFTSPTAASGEVSLATQQCGTKTFQLSGTLTKRSK